MHFDSPLEVATVQGVHDFEEWELRSAEPGVRGETGSGSGDKADEDRRVANPGIRSKRKDFAVEVWSRVSFGEFNPSLDSSYLLLHGSERPQRAWQSVYRCISIIIAPFPKSRSLFLPECYRDAKGRPNRNNRITETLGSHVDAEVRHPENCVPN